MPEVIANTSPLQYLFQLGFDPQTRGQVLALAGEA